MIWLASAMVVVTGLDLLLFGRPKPASYATMFVAYVGVRWLLKGQDLSPGWDRTRPWAPPARLSRGRARLVVGLGLVGLALAAGGLLMPDLLRRMLFMGMFIPIGPANLGWGVGSLLPEGRRVRALRLATLPFSIAMSLNMGAWLALLVSDRLS